MANIIAGRMARVNAEGIGTSTRGYNNGTFFAFCSVHVGTGGAKAHPTLIQYDRPRTHTYFQKWKKNINPYISYYVL